jgi:hypothetical protein
MDLTEDDAHGLMTRLTDEEERAGQGLGPRTEGNPNP